MYRDFLKVKGVNLTVKELKKQNKEENLYDVEIIDEFFKDCDEDEKVLIAAQGWAEEKNGFTILLKKQHNIEKNKTCEYNKNKKVRKSYCLKWRY